MLELVVPGYISLTNLVHHSVQSVIRSSCQLVDVVALKKILSHFGIKVYGFELAAHGFISLTN
ncbi:TPA: hypothetical protein DIC40_08585 [Patescibacteria group bacterium]|nr:hypothetical protein [Candidatus Gracilibacteria bacterium]